MTLDLRKFIFVDNHAHSLLAEHLQLDTFGFRQCFTESRSRGIIDRHLPNSLHYIELINSMSRILTTADEESLVTLRSRQQEAGWVRMLWDDVSLGALIIDDGFPDSQILTAAKLSAVSQRPVYVCRRIEGVVEQSLRRAGSFDELTGLFEKGLLDNADRQLVALKTICAYRGGLDIECVSEIDARADFERLKQDSKDSGRIERCPLYHFLLERAFLLAAAHNLPVQIHTGLGDDDADIISSNPALLQRLFRRKELSATNFVLLHCFPYIREAAFLASLYANVHLDLSLSVSLISGQADKLILEALSGAPATKILAGTDGHSCPETHWWGATCWKRGLADALNCLITGGSLSEQQASETAAFILHGNAIKLYGLEGLA